ncbi:hypothetical protein [Streptomyces sp. NPDC002580]|uniref:hypothetical protein n=1 Tax=Streptomyces sp. NPDC002580 TaxID=3364653 RepID=UPI0036805EEB
MAWLPGIGPAVIAGVALRISAVAGMVTMGLVRVAEWLPAQRLSDGSPSRSVAPIVDRHPVHAALLIVLALAFGGDTSAPAGSGPNCRPSARAVG